LKIRWPLVTRKYEKSYWETFILALLCNATTCRRNPGVVTPRSDSTLLICHVYKHIADSDTAMVKKLLKEFVINSSPKTTDDIQTHVTVVQPEPAQTTPDPRPGEKAHGGERVLKMV